MGGRSKRVCDAMRKAFLSLVVVVAMSLNPGVNVQGWRQYRNYSEKHCIGADFLTNAGPIFSKESTDMPFALVGGAGGGGKSYWLRSMAFELNLVLRNAGFPDCWGVLACDTYPNLRDRFINKFKEEFMGLGEFRNSQDRGYHFRFYGEGMGGVYFRNLDSAGGRRGAEYAWGLGDELTDWTYDQFAQFFYTLRTPKPLPFNARGFGSNPDGPGHQFVKELFVPQFRDLDNPFFELVDPANFLYVPMLVEDNMLYDVIGQTIEANIALIADPNVRRARRYGDWDIYGSGRFTMFRESVHKFDWPEFFAEYGLPESGTPQDFLRSCTQHGFSVYGSLDYGTSDLSQSVYYLHLVGPDNRPWTFAELVMTGLEAEKQAPKILDFERSHAVTVQGRVADPNIATRKQFEHKALTIQDRFRIKGVVFRLGINDRVQGAASVAALLDYDQGPNGEVLTSPSWRIHKSCKQLLKMLPNLPRDPDDPEDVDPRDGANHPYDSARYFLHSRYRGGVPRRRRPAMNSLAYFRELARLQDAGNRRIL
jgi:hypothetical protein